MGQGQGQMNKSSCLHNIYFNTVEGQGQGQGQVKRWSRSPQGRTTKIILLYFK